MAWLVPMDGGWFLIFKINKIKNKFFYYFYKFFCVWWMVVVVNMLLVVWWWWSTCFWMDLWLSGCCVYVPFNIRALHGGVLQHALHGGALQHALHGGWPYGFLAR
ncbi:unnamed protein product [Meloidogyne enterolobii]|uniref:Uncharacterized protein n=1 Tax=Meloidogyne enterolobii TaxID=390850 RepID=A0ACB1AFT2_MELEN